MNRFVLIDGNAMLHRAFHALPPLTSPDGVIVNAVYGFFSMLLKIIEDVKPRYLAVCFDRPKPTFRQALYVGYQIHRPKMSDDLVPQISIVHKILEEGAVPVFEVDGYEADDLIGTLVFQTQSLKNQKSVETIIVSGDRDLLQLVNPRVKMLAPITGITKMILFDQDSVLEKYGVKPSQVVDYKALTGDASDGYPGVSGIGHKTAQGLLKKYETFENLYQHLGELPPKISERLATDAEQAALAKKLATIITDAPVTIVMEGCALEQFAIDSMITEFEKIGFKSLTKRWMEYGGKKIAAPEKVQITAKVDKKDKKKEKKGKTESAQLGLLDT